MFYLNKVNSIYALFLLNSKGYSLNLFDIIDCLIDLEYFK